MQTKTQEGGGHALEVLKCGSTMCLRSNTCKVPSHASQFPATPKQKKAGRAEIWAASVEAGLSLQFAVFLLRL